MRRLGVVSRILHASACHQQRLIVHSPALPCAHLPVEGYFAKSALGHRFEHAHAGRTARQHETARSRAGSDKKGKTSTGERGAAKGNFVRKSSDAGRRRAGRRVAKPAQEMSGTATLHIRGLRPRVLSGTAASQQQQCGDEIEQLFGRFGTVGHIRVTRSGSAYFELIGAVGQAIHQMDGRQFNGRKLSVGLDTRDIHRERARRRDQGRIKGAASTASVAVPDTGTLFVRGVRAGLMRDDLKHLFARFGHVGEIRITGKGFAFVELSGNLAQAIQELDGQEFEGRCLDVDLARSAIDGDLHPGVGLGPSCRQGEARKRHRIEFMADDAERAAMGSVKARGRARAVLAEFESVANPVPAHYHAAIRACANAGLGSKAVTLLRKMKHELHMPALETYHTALRAIVNSLPPPLEVATRDSDAGFWDQRRHQREARLQGQRNAASLNALKLLRNTLLNGHVEDGCAPNSFTLHYALEACARAGDWRRAMLIVEAMASNAGLQPIERAHHSTTDMQQIGYDDGDYDHDHEGQVQLTHPLQLPPGAVTALESRTYELATQACVLEGRSETAMRLLEHMRVASRITPTAASYTAAITACNRAAPAPEWRAAILLLRRMQEDGIDASTATAAAVRACCNNERYIEAQALLAAMDASGLDTPLCNDLLRAYANRGQWRRAQRLLRHMKQSDGDDANEAGSAGAGADVSVSKARHSEVGHDDSDADPSFRGFHGHFPPPSIESYIQAVRAAMNGHQVDEMIRQLRELPRKQRQNERVPPQLFQQLLSDWTRETRKSRSAHRKAAVRKMLLHHNTHSTLRAFVRDAHDGSAPPMASSFIAADLAANAEPGEGPLTAQLQEILTVMNELGVEWTSKTWLAVLDALGTAREWKAAVGMLCYIRDHAPRAKERMLLGQEADEDGSAGEMGAAGLRDGLLELAEDIDAAHAFDAAIPPSLRPTLPDWKDGHGEPRHLFTARDFIKAYTSVAWNCQAAQEYDASLTTLHGVSDHGLRPSVRVMELALGASVLCDRAAWDDAWSMMVLVRRAYDDMNEDEEQRIGTAHGFTKQWAEQNRIRRDVRHRSHVQQVMSACARRGKWLEAINLLKSQNLAEYHTLGRRRLYANAMKACIAGLQWKRGLELLQEVRQLPPEMGIKPDAVMYTTAIGACVLSGNWNNDMLLRLLQNLREDNVEMDGVAFSAIASACVTAEGETFLRTATGQGLDKPGADKKVEHSVPGTWAAQALRIFDEMATEGIPMMVGFYQTALRACAYGGAWQRALQLLARMRAEGLIADPPSAADEHCARAILAAATACGVAGEWSRAEALLSSISVSQQIASETLENTSPEQVHDPHNKAVVVAAHTMALSEGDACPGTCELMLRVAARDAQWAVARDIVLGMHEAGAGIDRRLRALIMREHAYARADVNAWAVAADAERDEGVDARSGFWQRLMAGMGLGSGVTTESESEASANGDDMALKDEHFDVTMDTLCQLRGLEVGRAHIAFRLSNPGWGEWKWESDEDDGKRNAPDASDDTVTEDDAAADEHKYDFNLGRVGNREWISRNESHHSVPLDEVDEFIDLHAVYDSDHDADAEQLLDAKLPSAPTQLR